MKNIIKVCLLLLTCNVLFSQEYRHHKHEIILNEADTDAISASKSAIKGEFYYAADIGQHYVGQPDGTLKPYPTELPVQTLTGFQFVFYDKDELKGIGGQKTVDVPYVLPQDAALNEITISNKKDDIPITLEISVNGVLQYTLNVTLPVGEFTAVLDASPLPFFFLKGDRITIEEVAGDVDKAVVTLYF